MARRRGGWVDLKGIAMSLVYPNIVPENNLRLPDALTIKHGPARLLSTFVLEGDKAARQMGIRLRLRHDFGELLYVNKEHVARGNWYPLMPMFNHEYCNLTPENAYWISGEDEFGEIIATHAGHVHYWPHTTLEQEASEMLNCGRAGRQRVVVTAPDAKLITSLVVYGGAAWVRPDFRGQRLSQLLPRLGRAYALARWPIDWGITITAPVLVEKGVTAGYGYKHFSRSIIFPDAPTGAVENVLASVSASEAYDDFEDILVAGFLRPPASTSSTIFSSGNLRDSIDTNVSRDGVRHGRSNLS
jgi:GNAT superfamily N-acetyltransferase